MENANSGIRWFFGVVENIDDPQKGGRVQVRINNIHEQSKELLPTDYLPWCRVTTISTSSSSKNGVGDSPTGLEVGTNIIGISLDNMFVNLLSLFTWYSSNDETSSVHPLAKGVDSELSKLIKDSLLKDMEFSESNKLDEEGIVRDSIYPYNDVKVSRSGLEQEIDNSNEKVRVTNTHPSGTYETLDSSGNKITKRKSLIAIILERSIEYVGGSRFVSVMGDFVRRITGDNYVKTFGQRTEVSKSTLIKTEDGLEFIVPEIRVSGDMKIANVLYVKEIRVDTLKANNISCLGVIDGVVKYSSEAVKAASVSPPVIPVPGAGAGNISVNMSYTDNGGDYKFEVEKEPE